MEIDTRYGRLAGCFDEEFYSGGTLKSCSFECENHVETGCGTLIPRFGPENARRKYGKAVGFYPDGAIKRVVLEKQAGVISPIGEFPAELVTFYENGSVCRVFPLNGKISGFWSEADEEKLAVPLHFSFDFGEFSAKMISIHFYPGGSIQSITLFPCERITLQTPLGKVKIRGGFSLYEDGRLQSMEPAEPTPVTTPIGVLHAFDSNPVVVTADRNSLCLEPGGSVARLSTVTDEIIVQLPDARLERVLPLKKTNPLDDETTVTLPVQVEFQDGGVRLTCEKVHRYSLAECAFTILHVPYVAGFSPCSGCSGCGG
ncbi:hypothetical protein CAFE_19200 [Caprobacter fermentans]|uniref:Uncharacterized protein n=1 Tax=Caproicibacter fermentans TaxID=2576756 RepID=A0A6N8HZM8_9FIRM|nr:hypothetical protein [Caproicibacter fermentans]MVB11212.1 hypothetical protein [Caproicibacter fermentans]OCN00081.1 hypothetical protein A7X67_17430 [Clostridium sp. W14A]